MTDASTTTPIGRTPRPPEKRAAPFTHAVPLGRWGGIPVAAHWSVLVTLVLFADVLAASALPLARPGASAFAYWLTGVLTAAAFLATVLAHELSHAVVARHYGVRVNKVTLWMLGGMTELEDEPPTPRADALIAFAGPGTSLVIGGVCAGLAWAVGSSGLPGAALVWMAWISVFLGVFNLLPGTPLDGGRLLRALFWWHYHDRTRAVAAAARAGKVVGITLVMLGLLEVMAGALSGVWLALIGWFIINAATAEQSATLLAELGDLRADDVMSVSSVGSPEWWTVKQMLDQLSPHQVIRPVFPLVDFEGHPSGVITLRELERVPADSRDDTRLRDLLGPRRIPPVLVARDVQATDVARSLRLSGGIVIVVDEANHPIGVITDADLVQAAHLAHLGFHRHQELPS